MSEPGLLMCVMDSSDDRSGDLVFRLSFERRPTGWPLCGDSISGTFHLNRPPPRAIFTICFCKCLEITKMEVWGLRKNAGKTFLF